MTTPHSNSLFKGIGYFFKGFGVLFSPKVFALAIIPIILNLGIYVGLVYYTIDYLAPLIDQLSTYELPVDPKWWQYPIDWAYSVFGGILWVLFVAILILAVTYTFTLVTNIVGAPFYSFVSEYAEIAIRGHKVDSGESIPQIVVRAIGREFMKILYAIPRLLLVMIVGLIFAPAGLVLSILLACWIMALQFIDYPMDNHKVDFKVMRKAIGRYRFTSFGFGAVTQLFMAIPILNLFATPIAICGGTIYFIDYFEDEYSCGGAGYI